MVTGASQGMNLPRSFLKMRIGPHSQARTNSGVPSPSRSENTAPLTRPIFSKRCMRTKRPASLRNSSEVAGSGQRPGARVLAEHAFAAHVAPKIVNANRAAVGEAILVIARAGQ